MKNKLTLFFITIGAAVMASEDKVPDDLWEDLKTYLDAFQRPKVKTFIDEEYDFKIEKSENGNETKYTIRPRSYNPPFLLIRSITTTQGEKGEYSNKTNKTIDACWTEIPDDLCKDLKKYLDVFQRYEKSKQSDK